MLARAAVVLVHAGAPSMTHTLAGVGTMRVRRRPASASGSPRDSCGTTSDGPSARTRSVSEPLMPPLLLHVAAGPPNQPANGVVCLGR